MLNKLVFGMIMLAASTQVFAGELKVLSCDVVVIKVKNGNATPDSPYYLSGGVVLDSGDQFQAIVKGGPGKTYRETSPIMTQIAPNVWAGKKKVPGGHLTFGHKDDSYMISDNEIDWMTFANCVDDSKML